jgi:hypothetical protein
VKFLAAGPALVLAIMSAVGAAHAQQCEPTDKIYIDPRLVPKPRSMSLEDFQRMMNAPGISPEIKAQVYQQLRQQGQPIVVPYGTGKVLVHPTNPCISNISHDEKRVLRTCRISIRTF